MIIINSSYLIYPQRPWFFTGETNPFSVQSLNKMFLYLFKLLRNLLFPIFPTHLYNLVDQVQTKF